MRVRRKPTEHDAILYTGKNCGAVARFVGEDRETWAMFDRCKCKGDQPWMVPTMHGHVEAEPGTWIVKGQRDYWPVDADQFADTYEMAADLGPNAMPDRIAIDAHGYGWRVWDDQETWSMVPQNPDNDPIPEPLTWFVPERSTERTKRQLDFLLALADGGEITINGMPWREVFEKINALVSDPV